MRNNNKVMAVAALCLSVVGLSVGFAALSSTLTINGTGKVKASTWNVHFKNMSAAKLTGDAVEKTMPSLGTTTLGDYEVEFTSPGDSIAYTVEILNEGDYDAKLSTLTIKTPKCTGTGSNAAIDAKNVCDNLTYTLTNTDSDYITNTGTVDNCSFAEGETCLLPKDVRRTVEVKLAYSDKVTSELLPKGDVTISNLDIAMIFTQK